MAATYIVEGTAALKSRHEVRTAGALVPLPGAHRTSGFCNRLFEHVHVYGREQTEVDAVLDNFSGSRLSDSFADRVFAIAVGAAGAAVLFALTFLSVL